ncbi:uncharacterized protein LOC108739859 isoform X2 [Agrilus planipennis]|uniref:Uncharacterized protein LOC108739859 isoform X2 n=1 Tax=Agrilus planipennis TaxID=224129 RepID=A0A1W4X038_AGRPL|nr:uncharacterized protein LOC108739859 isoform X2 [Agrilus planipennis]
MDSTEDSPVSPKGPPSQPPPSLPPPLPERPPKKHGSVTSPKSPEDYKADNEMIELDEETSQQMTTSYSEISFKSGMSPETEVSLSLTMDSIPSADHILQRPISLAYDTNNIGKPLLPLNSEGTVHVEGNMTHFVTEDLEYKIKISSPVSKFSGNSKSGTPSYTQKGLLMTSVSSLDPNILNDLEFEAQKIATSVDTLTENLCGILHSSMYTVMAKTEELSHSMKSVQHLASRIKEMRRLIDLFESL